jgi:hypothetical protein
MIKSCFFLLVLILACSEAVFEDSPRKDSVTGDEIFEIAHWFRKMKECVNGCNLAIKRFWVNEPYLHDEPENGCWRMYSSCAGKCVAMYYADPLTCKTPSRGVDPYSL